MLRANWLKRLYDVLLHDPHIFTSDDAVVQLGVGKNMVEAMRYWAVMTNMITQSDDKGWQPTAFAQHILADDGIDPFIVLPGTRWWLHWQLVRSPAFTWRYIFMHMNGNTVDVESIAHDIATWVLRMDYKPPAPAVLQRDIHCVMRCYTPNERNDVANEELFLCPLNSLQVMQSFDQQTRLTSGARDDIPDELIVAAIADAMQHAKVQSIPFADLMWGPHGPGRLFRLHEDALLDRVSQLEYLTQGAAVYSDHAGVRAVQWANVDQVSVDALALQGLQGYTVR